MRSDRQIFLIQTKEVKMTKAKRKGNTPSNVINLKVINNIYVPTCEPVRNGTYWHQV